MSSSNGPRTVSTDQAPKALGPYSQAVSHGGFLFCSGQIGLDPASGELVGGSTAEQARRCLENLSAVCQAAGTSLDRALQVLVYLTDVADFAEVNDIYAGFFGQNPPARVTVGVADLPAGARVEIVSTVAL